MIGDLLFVSLVLIFSFTVASNHVVPQLFVGNYYKGYNGENIPATSSLLLNPMGGWSDSNGNFYIADQTRIRKVDTFGIMKTICGLTLSGVNFHLPPQPFGSWAIDETPATATTLSHVRSVWGDTLGNLFFIDGDRLRKVDVMTSNVTTMVGDRGLNHFTGENVTGTSTSLYGYFMTGDSAGNLYYSDSKYHRVRKFVKSTGRVLTIAGNGTNAYGGERIIATSTSINEPAGLVVDTSGNVFFIEQSSFRIRRVTKAGIMQTIVGTGFKCSETWDGLPGTSTDLCEPSSLYIDSLGNLFWVETDFNILRKFTRRTSLVSTLLDKYGSGYAGDGLNIISKTSQILMNAQGVWSNSRGDLFIADGSNYRVRSIANQIINTVAGNGYLSYGGDGGPATSAYINTPSSLWGNTLGTVYFADMNNYRIRAISAAGIITTLGGTGKSGPFTADGTAFTSMSLSNIQTLSGDSYGNIYFLDNNRLRRYVISSSTVQTLAGTGDVGYNGNNVSASSVYFYYPNAMWVNTKGDVYITEPSQRVRLYKKATERVWDFAGNGLYQYSEDNVPATQTSLNPSGVWGDTEGNVFISDHANYRIRRVLLNGIITTFAGNGRKGWDDVNRISATSAAIGSPTSVSGDSLGNIYFSETSFCRILLVTSSGLDYSNAVVNTIFEASGCSSIYCPNANAIWIDSIGSIYTVEKSFNFIRKILYNTTSQSTMTVLPTYSPHSELKFVTSREGGVEREKSYPE